MYWHAFDCSIAEYPVKQPELYPFGNKKSSPVQFQD